MIQADGDAGEDGGQRREVRSMYGLTLRSEGKMRAQVCASTSHNANSRMGIRAAPENSKLVAPGCIERHGNTDKGVNVGEKRTQKGTNFCKVNCIFQICSFLLKLMLVVQAKCVGMKNEEKKRYANCVF